VLTEEQRATFARDGILKLPRAFSAEDAARMQAVLWEELRARHGIRRDDRSTWPVGEASHMKTSKRSPAFAPICGPAVSGALDDLFGPGGWYPPKHFGNVLVTFPNASEWRVPHRIWHEDLDIGCPSEPLFGVKLWALCDDVEPGGGGTPHLAGSHRLFARYLESAPHLRHSYKEAKLGFLASHPWLQALTRDDGDPGRNERLLDVEVDLDGLPARVVETTGSAGDMFITHGWLYHSIAVNTRDRPRMMRSGAVMARPAGSARNENVF
jgi:hypothetical protein